MKHYMYLFFYSSICNLYTWVGYLGGLVDQQTGKYLGTLSANPYDQDSVSNIYGRYGSPYSQDSINNSYGEYGSPYFLLNAKSGNLSVTA